MASFGAVFAVSICLEDSDLSISGGEDVDVSILMFAVIYKLLILILLSQLRILQSFDNETHRYNRLLRFNVYWRVASFFDTLPCPVFTRFFMMIRQVTLIIL